MNDALLVVDVLNDFRHEDGARLAESFRAVHPQLREVLSSSREANLPIIYANDHFGDRTADGDAIVDRALAGVRRSDPADRAASFRLRSQPASAGSRSRSWSTPARLSPGRMPRLRSSTSAVWPEPGYAVGRRVPVRDRDYQDSTAA